MMVAMKLRSSIAFHGSPDQVLGLLAEEGFREQVARSAGAETAEAQVRVAEDGGSVTVIESRQPTSGMPALATKFLGEHLAVRQEEHWTPDGRGTLSVTFPGQPGQVSGVLALSEDGGRTVQSLEADIAVRIPLVGGKVEALIGQMLEYVLGVQEQVGNRRLAGDPPR